MLLSFSPHSTFLTQFNKGSYMAAMNIRCLNRHISISSQPLHPMPLAPHMWYVILDEVHGTSLLEQYLEILSPSEKQTVLSLKDDELRKRAILARTLVRTTISRYQTNPRIDPRSLSFKKNSYGKPEESYVKALGRGFSATPFNTFRISCKASSISVPDVPYIASSKFALLELVDTHYASICIENDTGFEGTEESPMMVRVWKTIPFLEDLCVSGTPSVATVGDLVEQRKPFCWSCGPPYSSFDREIEELKVCVSISAPTYPFYFFIIKRSTKI
ncbi:hypothetical protein Cgig2_021347 [Carnegiea gigantea]|uniref:holo-[acyl-carrier-protein] synthase n=1 Tax=Carnegiea gigantea TaxID=171969 RepID=A0A9Q1JYB0_9CARY|nr:hypothetical protein Cgig2_021347 [Carnegiea gigantea]